MEKSTESCSNQLTKHDLDCVFQTPWCGAFSTLEELAETHNCTVDEIAAVADLANPIACVEAAMKLSVQKRGVTHGMLNEYLLRRHLLDMFTYILCGCEDAITIEDADDELAEYDEDGNDISDRPYKMDKTGCYTLDSQFLIDTCAILGLRLKDDCKLYWMDIQDLAIDLEVEIKLMVFGLDDVKDIPTEWLEDWESMKTDMLRIDMLLKEKPSK